MTTGQLPAGSSRIILGTAQFAGDYGVMRSPTHGAGLRGTSSLEILHVAESLGVCALDTAPVYGQSEAIVGSSEWRGMVWTKLNPALTPEESLSRSLSALKRCRVDVLYVHDVRRFLSLDQQLVDEIAALRGARVGALGVSAYEPAEALAAMHRLHFDVVQLPINPFDTRLSRALEANLLPRDSIYVGRSVFLQGLLAMDQPVDDRVPASLRGSIRRWQRTWVPRGIAPGEAALVWALSHAFLQYVTVGADSTRHLQEIISWSHSSRASEILDLAWTEDLWPDCDPRTWM